LQAGRLNLIHRCAAAVGERDVVAGFGGQIGGQPANGRLLAADWELRACFEQLASSNRRFQVAQRRIFLFSDRPDAATSPARNTILRIYQPNLVCYSAAEPFNGHIDGIWTVSPGALSGGWYAIVHLQQRYVEFKRLETPGSAAMTIEMPALRV
jgi:hypothetical protein